VCRRGFAHNPISPDQEAGQQEAEQSEWPKANASIAIGDLTLNSE